MANRDDGRCEDNSEYALPVSYTAAFDESDTCFGDSRISEMAAKLARFAGFFTVYQTKTESYGRSVAKEWLDIAHKLVYDPHSCLNRIFDVIYPQYFDMYYMHANGKCGTTYVMLKRFSEEGMAIQKAEKNKEAIV